MNKEASYAQRTALRCEKNRFKTNKEALELKKYKALCAFLRTHNPQLFKAFEEEYKMNSRSPLQDAPEVPEKAPIQEALPPESPQEVPSQGPRTIPSQKALSPESSQEVPSQEGPRSSQSKLSTFAGKSTRSSQSRISQ